MEAPQSNLGMARLQAVKQGERHLSNDVIKNANGITLFADLPGRFAGKASAAGQGRDAHYRPAARCA